MCLVGFVMVSSSDAEIERFVRPTSFNPLFRAVPSLGIRGGGIKEGLFIKEGFVHIMDLQYNIGTTILVPVRYR